MLLVKDSTLPIIDLSCPVNTSHPQNLNRLAWWLAQPATSGGRFLYDLMGLYPATLNGAAWGTTSRPGGCMHLNFASAYLSIPTITLAGDFSIAFWEFFPGGTSLGSTYFAIGSNTATINHASGNIRLTISGSDAIVSGNATPVGSWLRYVFTRSGSLYSIYLNGALDTAATATASSISISGIGFNGTTGTAGGSMDDVAIWARALSGVDVVQDYFLSTHNYPSATNRPTIKLAPATGSQTVGMIGSSSVMAAATVTHSTNALVSSFNFAM